MSAALDHAVHAHMAHGAMTCDDPLTECLCAELAPQPDLPAQPVEVVPMWPELQAPGRWAAIYAGTLLGALLLSHAYAQGWLQ